jgi:hypothetical protein
MLCYSCNLEAAQYGLVLEEKTSLSYSVLTLAPQINDLLIHAQYCLKTALGDSHVCQ